MRTNWIHRLQAQHVDIFRKIGGHDMGPMELGSDVETEKKELWNSEYHMFFLNV